MLLLSSVLDVIVSQVESKQFILMIVVDFAIKYKVYWEKTYL